MTPSPEMPFFAVFSRALNPTFPISTSDMRFADLPVTNNQNLSGLQPKKQVFFLIFRLKTASKPRVIQAPLPKSDKQRHLSSHLIRNTGR